MTRTIYIVQQLCPIVLIFKAESSQKAAEQPWFLCYLCILDMSALKLAVQEKGAVECVKAQVYQLGECWVHVVYLEINLWISVIIFDNQYFAFNRQWVLCARIACDSGCVCPYDESASLVEKILIW